jgi:rhodanese-related sulfurtransferase
MGRVALRLLLVASAVFVAACQNQQAAPQANANTPVVANGQTLPTAPEGTAKITVAEAKKAVDSGQAVMVDVREEPAYRQEHIKGAIHLPAPQTGSRIQELPKDKLLITYCSCPAEQSSMAASQMYRVNGYYNTAFMVGGTDGWKKAGYPMSAGSTP